MFKTCSFCQIEKPLIDYHKNKKSKDGHLTVCKLCRKEGCKEYYQNNKAKQYETQKQCRQKKRDHYERQQEMPILIHRIPNSIVLK